MQAWHLPTWWLAVQLVTPSVFIIWLPGKKTKRSGDSVFLKDWTFRIKIPHRSLAGFWVKGEDGKHWLGRVSNQGHLASNGAHALLCSLDDWEPDDNVSRLIAFIHDVFFHDLMRMHACMHAFIHTILIDNPWMLSCFAAKIFEHPRLRAFMDARGFTSTMTWLGMYGGRTPKPVRLVSDDPFVNFLRKIHG